MNKAEIKYMKNESREQSRKKKELIKQILYVSISPVQQINVTQLLSTSIAHFYLRSFFYLCVSKRQVREL